jgi:putative transcriptional regulator
MENRIAQLRQANGWTQADLAAELGVSRQTVISIERGKYDPSLPLAFRISAVFGRPIEELFDPPAD